jgi:hypothetical protein
MKLSEGYNRRNAARDCVAVIFDFLSKSICKSCKSSHVHAMVKFCLSHRSGNELKISVANYSCFPNARFFIFVTKQQMNRIFVFL